jgi:competence protein ComFC
MAKILDGINAILAFLFPDSCIACRRRGELLCSYCIATIPSAPPTPGDYISATFEYKDVRVRKLVWLLKYKNTLRVANIFGKHMAKTLEDFLQKNSFPNAQQEYVLVPIPLSSHRRRTRGYNQSEFLARAMVKNSLVYTMRVENKLLVKTQNTFAQAKVKNRVIRQKNLRNCFFVKRGVLPVSTPIILIDDVVTTGATIFEARRVLCNAGFVHVYAQTAAH